MPSNHHPYNSLMHNSQFLFKFLFWSNFGRINVHNSFLINNYTDFVICILHETTKKMRIRIPSFGYLSDFFLSVRVSEFWSKPLFHLEALNQNA